MQHLNIQQSVSFPFSMSQTHSQKGCCSDKSLNKLKGVLVTFCQQKLTKVNTFNLISEDPTVLCCLVDNHAMSIKIFFLTIIQLLELLEISMLHQTS